MNKNEIQFIISYNTELNEQRRVPAPQIDVITDTCRMMVPVAVTAMARTDFILAGGNPMADRASPHEITLGVVVDDEEGDLSKVILARYMAHPQRRAGLTEWRTVAELIDRLNGLCNQEANVFYRVGDQLTAHYGVLPQIVVGNIVRHSDRITDEYNHAIRNFTPHQRATPAGSTPAERH